MMRFWIFWLAMPAFADTSRRNPGVDPRRFDLIRQIPAAQLNLLSPSGEHVARYVGNSIELLQIGKDTPVTLNGHTMNIHDGGWSKDGRILATSGYDGTVRLWDVEKGQEIVSVNAHAGYA